MIKKMTILITVIMFSAYVPAESFAVPYKGYTYNEWGRPVPSPVGYKPEKVIWGTDFAIGGFSGPRDMFVSSQNNIYILDSGNSRIIVLDSSFSLKKVIDKFEADSGTMTLSNPGGIFVDADEDIYIADSDNQRVLVADSDGVLKKQIVKPVSHIYPQHNDFRPQKILADNAGNVYVIIAGLYQGAAIFNKEGRFEGFFGSNKVELTAKILRDIFWKKIMTKKQKENTERYVPVEYTSFDIDDDNFVYTCSARTMNNTDEIKKLNPMGQNIFVPVNYGDLEGGLLKGEWLDTSFTDIAVDNKNLIYALDATRNKIFQYDQESNLVFVFGTRGAQKGAFISPQAVDTLNDRVLVLDSVKGSITVFRRTEFGEKVIKALELYNDGRYEDALKPWKSVLVMDANYSLAYISIGKTYFSKGEYRKAMEYFKTGAHRKGESEAFRELRTQIIRKHFGWYVSVIFLLALLVYAFRRRDLIMARLGYGSNGNTQGGQEGIK